MTLRKDPFTGKMVEYKPKAFDAVDPRPVPNSDKAAEQERIEIACRRIRENYRDLGQARYGARGEKLIVNYRRLTLEYMHICGRKPPKIDAEL